MENWFESMPSNRIKGTEKLPQGQQSTYKLQDALQSSEVTEPEDTSIDDVWVQILEMFENNTLSVMGSSTFNELPQLPTSGMENWSESMPSNRIKGTEKLPQGQQSTYKLQDALQSSEVTEPEDTSIDEIWDQILQMSENNTLSVMGSSTFNELPQLPTSGLYSCNTLDARKIEISNESPKSVIPVKLKRGCYKRRNNSRILSTKITTVLADDGYAWRKYGQKNILNSKHKRSYYRCTYKLDQGCQATKQVQKMADKPPTYQITYFGNHTCQNLQRTPPIIMESARDTSTVLSFETLTYDHEGSPPPLGNYNHKLPLPSNTYPSWEHVSHIPLDSISTMLPGLDYEDMISSTAYLSMANDHVSNQMDQIMFGMNDFNQFPF